MSDVVVVIAAYTERRWNELVRAVETASSGTLAPREVIVVVDRNPALAARARDAVPQARVLENREGNGGTSVSRNLAIEASDAPIVAFLDDDAAADRHWLERLRAVFDDPAVAAAGGLLRPDWPAGKPSWFPEEFNWVVGCSYLGMPVTRQPIRNPFGANMAYRREVFDHIGLFSTAMGRVGTRPLGGEETELCIRIWKGMPGSIVVYEPAAIALHRVDPSRGRVSYFLRRCWSEGLSKALVTASVGAGSGLQSERAYTLRVLPLGVLRGLADAIRGDRSGLARALAIIAGLTVTVAGYAWGLAERARTARAAD